MKHADDFGALFVDGHGVEVVDFLVALRTDRMRHGAGVLGELRGAQGLDVFDALHRAGRRVAEHVGGKFLVAENGEAFLEGELEPVAKRHAVTRPVVEVLVRDHGLDVEIVAVCRDRRIGEGVAGVEDVESLVFHRAEVEVVRRDDHEEIEVQVKTEAFFVPGDGALEAFHRVFGFVDVLRLHPDFERHFAAVAEILLAAAFERARDERKEVAGFRIGVDPANLVATVEEVARLDPVAVREKDRVERLGRADRDGELREHVRTVGPVGDSTKTRRFALAHEVLAGSVDSGERRVLRGAETVDDDDLRRFAQRRDRKRGVGEGVFALRERPAVDVHAHERDGLAVEDEVEHLVVRLGIGTHVHRGRHRAAVGVEIEFEVNRIDEMRGNLVVFSESRAHSYAGLCRNGVGPAVCGGRASVDCRQTIAVRGKNEKGPDRKSEPFSEISQNRNYLAWATGRISPV